MQEMENIERAAAAIQETESMPPMPPSEGTKAMRPGYRPLSDDEAKTLEYIKNLGAQLWDVFHHVGNSREIALAKTNLEQAVMWSVKHVTR